MPATQTQMQRQSCHRLAALATRICWMTQQTSTLQQVGLTGCRCTLQESEDRRTEKHDKHLPAMPSASNLRLEIRQQKWFAH